MEWYVRSEVVGKELKEWWGGMVGMAWEEWLWEEGQVSEEVVERLVK